MSSFKIYNDLFLGILYSSFILFSHSPKLIVEIFFDFSDFWFSVVLIVTVESFCLITTFSPLSNSSVSNPLVISC